MSDVANQSKAVAAMAVNWPMIASLLGGTTAMRSAGEKLLPKWPNEDAEAYKARLATATLFPAFARTIEVLTGKPFSKPLTFGADVPTQIQAWCEDVDLQGRNLHAFAAGVCEEAMGYGLSGILVDYPTTTDKDGKALYPTVDAERKAGVRPYFVQIRPQQILGWRSARVNGAEVLTQLRLLETVAEDDGEFGENEIEQVRVLTPGAWEVWRKTDAGKWEQSANGTTTLKRVPFVPVYGKRVGFMQGVSPLVELAHMNVKHWQSQSDQDTLLHVARVPILAVSGVESDSTFQLIVGASAAVKLPQGGELKFVEHTGNAIEAGRKSLLDLEDQSRQAGAELLVIKPGNVTEAQTVADNEQGSCALQRIVRDEKDAINQALQIMAEWVGLPDGGHVEIYNDFGAATLAEASAALLKDMAGSGALSKETVFEELQRRGIIRPELKWKDERERIEAQGPPLGAMIDG